LTASRISACSNGDTWIVWHAAGKPSACAGSMYSDRIATLSKPRVWCSTPGAIHSAWPGATTQLPRSVITVTTPLMAYSSWPRSCRCRELTVPAG